MKELLDVDFTLRIMFGMRRITIETVKTAVR